ncbi:MAG: phage major capsid protein [Candidatus Helarchaeota archaeon]
MKDIFTPDATRFVQETVIKIIKESLEPNLLISTNLFQKINLNQRTIEIGAVGALIAHPIPEAAEYPTADLQFDKGKMTSVYVQKYGLRLPITREMIEDSQYDVINLWLRAAGRALARRKELVAVKYIEEMGTVLFDNLNPANSEYGVTTGRDITGAQNWTYTFNDLIRQYAFMTMRGFTPNVLLMHPMAWAIFAVDPLMREIVINGAKVASEGLPEGTYAQNWGAILKGLGYNTTAVENPFGTALQPWGATFYTAPRYLPIGLKVLVTPFVRYAANATSDGLPLTDIVFADSNNAGILVQRSEPSTERWEDPSRDMVNLKVSERYGMNVLMQGRGITIARNVVIDKNYVFDNVNSVTLSKITQKPVS